MGQKKSMPHFLSMFFETHSLIDFYFVEIIFTFFLVSIFYFALKVTYRISTVMKNIGFDDNLIKIVTSTHTHIYTDIKCATFHFSTTIPPYLSLYISLN